MTNFLNKIKLYVFAHKITTFVVLVLFVGVCYFGYTKFKNTNVVLRYVTSKVEKGTIIAMISGSGQVSASNQVDIKPKTSGEVVYIATVAGEKINQGGLVAQLDNKDALKSVRDAEVNLESAKISLDKLKIQKSNENMNSDLAKSYDDGFNNVSNVFLDLPGIMSGLNDMFFKSSAGTQQQWNIDWYEGQVGGLDRDKAVVLKQNLIDSYNKAKKAYDLNFDNYKIVSRTSDDATIETLIKQTYDTTKLISDVIKNSNNYIDFINAVMQKNNTDIPNLIPTHKAILNTYTAKTNTHLVNLLGVTTNIKSFRDAFPSASLDIQSAELSVRQRENALQDAKDKLSDYFIRAPFSGTLATLNIKKSDSVSAGTSVGALITKNKIAEISLNEVDVAKVKIGQKATLTFDAIPDLSISGSVADIDTIGTVSQGVVTYVVKISFDTQDERIKPGMSVSSNIITDIKQDVLVVPNSAIKSQGGESYVEVFGAPLPAPADGLIGSISSTAPNKIGVQVGLSNDKDSEIISGLNEGEEIVSRTISSATTKTNTPTPSLFGTGGGGGVRVQR